MKQKHYETPSKGNQDLLQCNKTSCITTEFKITFYFPYWFSHVSVSVSVYVYVLSIWWHIKTMWILFLKPVFQEVIHMPYLWSGLALMSAIFRLDIVRKPKYVFFPYKACFRLTFSSVFLLPFDGHTFLYNLLFRFTFFTTTASFTFW